MTLDLSRALDEAARHAPLGSLQIGTLADRVRRRRAFRTAARSAAGVGLVGAVLVAAAVLNGVDTRPHPVPPAVPSLGPAPSATPTPTPTPSATSAGAVLPSGDPSLPFGTCGALVTTAPADPVVDWFEVTTTLGTEDLAAGEPLTVRSRIERVGDGVRGAVPAIGPRAVLVRDGVVVATLDAPDDSGDQGSPWTVRAGFPFETAAHTWGADLRVCDSGEASVTPGRALPAGDYELHPWARVVRLDQLGTEEVPSDAALDDMVTQGGTFGTVLGDVLPVRITGDAGQHVVPTEPALDRVATSPAPACGDPAPTAPSTTVGLAVGFTPTGRPEVAAGEELDLGAAATITYRGPGTLSGLLDWWVTYWIVQDGVVVGSTWVSTDASTGPVMMGSGGSFAVPANPLAVTGCVGTGETSGLPLPAGDYTVIPSLWVTGLQVSVDGERFAPTSADAQMVLGAPFEVRVR